MNETFQRHDKMDFPQPLLSEIDRQLAIQPISNSLEPQRLPVISVYDDINTYRTDLTLLRQAITEFEEPDVEALENLVVRPENLIWQIPAFSNNGIVIDQEYATERTSALLNLRSVDNNFTDDIWDNKEVADWSSCTKSRILVITGTSQTLERLEKFSVELINHLSSKVAESFTTRRHTTLYLLSPLPKEAYELPGSSKQGRDVLRHLAVQSLRAARPSGNQYTIRFLAEIVCLFKSSETTDWFNSLTNILAYHSHVNIVLSIRTLGNHFRDAHQWPAGFLQLVQKLEGKTVVRVMLISGRPIDCPVDPAMRTMTVSTTRPLTRKDPLHLRGPSYRGGYAGFVDRCSNLYQIQQGANRSEITTRSPPPNPSSDLGLNLQSNSSNPEGSTNHLIEDPDDRNRLPIVDQKDNSSKVFQGKDTCGLTENMGHLDLGALQFAGFESSEDSARQWFRKLETMTHKVIYGQSSSSPTPVKIAVLDTGFAYTDPQDKRLLKPYYQRVKKFANFIDGHTDLDAKKDPSGHGTAVAVQILKVNLNAILYICRVASFDGTYTAPDLSAVERAIRKAASKPDKDQQDGGGWGVDIINMSFGWSYQHECISKAIDLARQNGVHLFASTSNYGLLGPPNDILYPARSDSVIAVDAADGLGEHATTTPSLSSQHSRGSRFSAPGLGLSCPNSKIIWSGSSFACPIAAGIGALILEFTRQPPLDGSPSVQKCLQDMPAMLALLRRMSSEKGPDGLKFLTPWKLTGESSEERLFVSMDIVKELRNEYGPKVGSEVPWRF